MIECDLNVTSNFENQSFISDGETNYKSKVVFILGPTGVGKTSFSIQLAKAFDGEIISADSVQIFKEFDIGSAKITKDEMEGVVHYGIDIVSPEEEFSVYDYVKFTKRKIKEIQSKGKLPIIVGGTGLYVKSLIENYNFGGTDKRPDFRESLEKEIEEKGLEFVFNRLEQLNPVLAEKIDKKNKVRVIRAFEIALFGSEKTKQEESEYDFKIFALNLERQKLYDRINMRVDLMLKNGLIKEVEKLYCKYGYCQPMRAIGYKEVVDFINAKCSESEMVEKIKQHSRNYAKRQLTFLKGIDKVQFIDVEDKQKALDLMIKEITKWLVIQNKF